MIRLIIRNKRRNRALSTHGADEDSRSSGWKDAMDLRYVVVDCDLREKTDGLFEIDSLRKGKMNYSIS